MDEPTRVRLIEILDGAPEVYLPAGRLLAMLQGQGLAAGVDRPAFLEALRGEPRLELLEPQIHSLPGESEVGVKLAGRALTAEAVMAALAHNLSELNEALHKAWQSRPPGDDQTEALLREVQARAEELSKEIGELGQARSTPPPSPGGRS